MAYGRFRRAGKSSRPYGRKRIGRVRRTGRGYTKVPRFATVGYAKNVEKKYYDKTYAGNHFEQLTGLAVSNNSNGVTYVSGAWGTYSFGAQTASSSISNDMLKGLGTGTTARTRIGNKIRTSYIKGALTFTAATLNTKVSKVQGGEVVAAMAESATYGYLRTTYRMLIVKDMQVNSTDAQITWAQVMDTTNLQAGIHSELNVDNMGRFLVLEDKVFTVDAQNPQKTCPFTISGSRVGNVRYNGPSETALTDKGIYVVWAAFVLGFNGPAATDIDLPSPVGHSRLSFNDD